MSFQKFIIYVYDINPTFIFIATLMAFMVLIGSSAIQCRLDL